MKLKTLAQDLVEDKYHLSHFMIDKSMSELNGIRAGKEVSVGPLSTAHSSLTSRGTVDPDALVRLCQFHVVQAISRMEQDNGTRGSPMRMSMPLKVEIIYFFRILQRCRRWEDWEETKATFFDRVKNTVMTQGHKGDPAGDTGEMQETRHAEQWEFIRNYFEVNWFTATWIREHLYSLTSARGATWRCVTLNDRT